MTTDEIISAKKRIDSHIKARRLSIAFMDIKAMLNSCTRPDLKDKVEEIETTYRYMIKYLLDGVSDPDREKLYRSLLLSLYTVADLVTDELMTKSAALFIYDKKRFYKESNRYSLKTEADKLKEAEDREAMQLSVMAEDAPLEDRKRVESCQDEVFLQLLINYPASVEDYKVTEYLLNNTVFTIESISLVVSALTLSTLQNFDENKILLLLDTYSITDDEAIKQRALCGVLILCYLYRDRVSLSKNITERIILQSEDKIFRRDIVNIFLQLIRTMETEKISNIFTSEILPEMIKISPDLYKKMSDKGGDEERSLLSKNPEWEDVLEVNPIAKKIKELNDLQTEGSDVMMSTFSALKSFPFFSKISNWLRPFSISESDVAGVFKNLGSFGEMLQGAKFICNSDKYSLALAMRQIPDAQKEIIFNQLPQNKQESENITENDSDGTAAEAKAVSKCYLQDLYRFFKLYPQNRPQNDIFSEHVDLFEILPLRSVLEEDDTMKLIAELYLKKEYYNYACKYFSILVERDLSNAVLHQKLGYCMQMQKDYDGAIREYLMADNLSHGFWTLHHLATCYRASGDIRNALRYYGEALELRPDNLTIELQSGHCYMSLKDYDNALKHYFKVEYLSEGGVKSWRPIAWCSLMLGKTEQAESYYNKILSNSPSANDYLNAGHTALILKKIPEAFALYKKSLERETGGIDKFIADFSKDRQTLEAMGIQPEELSIILDQLTYQSEN